MSGEIQATEQTEIEQLRARVTELERINAELHQQLEAQRLATSLSEYRAEQNNDLLGLYDLLIEHSHEGLMVIDAQGQVIFANPVMQAMLAEDPALPGRVLNIGPSELDTREIAIQHQDGTRSTAEIYVNDVEWHQARNRVVLCYEMTRPTTNGIGTSSAAAQQHALESYSLGSESNQQ